MKLFFTFIACCCIFWILESNAKYLISANDSVNVQNCDLETVKNISLLNANPEEIIIHNCHINELPNALFIRFQKLRILEITESQLLTISDYAFNGLNALQLLNLSRNNLTTVKTWSNENLKELHLLDLRRNAISSIHRNAFERFSNLLKLNLAVNHISEIPDELFRSVPALKYLNLGKNELKSIDSHTFKHLHKLIHLELRHNQIEFIEADSFVGCTHLKVLHLQENQISLFHEELISNMPRLHHLNLSHNVLERFSDETFAKNEELLSLDISFNLFDKFNELTFKGLEVLEVFNASHNMIANVDMTVFKEFVHLLILDLSNNQIKRLPDQIFNATLLLQSIKLNNNSLEQIDDAVFADLKMKLLDLSCNQLSNDNFLWLSLNIDYLNLTYNNFKEINASVLENTLTDLWGNPFNCEWLVNEGLASKNVRLGRNYVVDSRLNVIKAEGIQCFEESGLKEHRLIVVESKLKWNNEEISVENLNQMDSTMKPSSDDFDFRSSLLWLSCGCLGVLVALRLLKCFLNKSEKQSEEYRAYQQRPLSQQMKD